MYRSMQKKHVIEGTAETGGRQRGRPRAFDREDALAKATLLFWEKGYDATSISDLTAAMGIGSPSLYAAFGSKDALYVEAIDYYARTYDSFVWSRFRASKTARDAVRNYLMDSTTALSGKMAPTPRGCMVTLARVGNDEHPDLAYLLKDARGATRARLEARLAKARDEGELAADADIEALARYVFCVQAGMSVLARDGATPDELRTVVDVALAGWDDFLPGSKVGGASSAVPLSCGT
jgi:AcrR family transcriptional regulator